MAWLNCFQPDLVCLQETHSKTIAEFSTWFSHQSSSSINKHHYHFISSPGTIRSRGVAILYLPKFRLLSHRCDSQGHLVVGKFSFEECIFQLVCLYGLNNKKDGAAFFESIPDHVDYAFMCIVCGDFNTVVDPTVDRRGCNITSAYAYNWSGQLDSFMDSLNLCDMWRLKHPSASEFTWNDPVALRVHVSI